MTSKIVTFTLNIANPAEPKVTQVTLGQQPVDPASAKNTSSVMAQLMKKQLSQLKKNHKTYYDEKLASSNYCTVTLKTAAIYNRSRPKKPLTESFPGQLYVQISNDKGVDIVQPLKKELGDKLDIGSLEPQVSTSSKSHKGKQSSASTAAKNGALSSNHANESQPLQPFWDRMTQKEFDETFNRLSQLPHGAGNTLKLPSSAHKPVLHTLKQGAKRTKIEKPSLPTNESEERRLIKLFHQDCEKQIKATPIPPAAPNFFYRFFAAIINAIGDYFRSFCSLFSSDNDELHDESLTQEPWKDYTTDTDESVTYHASDAAPAKSIHGILPLSNGNNICFINGSFQSLMNIPDLMPVLIPAHEAKIKKEQARIQELQDQINAYNLVNSTPNEDVSKLQTQKNVLQKSIQASKTLIKACEAYKDDGKKPVGLNDLRGFSENFRSDSQEDAEELLVRIWDPVLEPLRNGINAEGKRDVGCIPTNLHQSTLNVLGQFVPKIGEEKQLERVDAEPLDLACRQGELRNKKDVSKLPPNGLLKTVAVASSIPFAVPPLKPDEKIALQTLVTKQLTMQPLQEKDGTSVYEQHNGIKSDYEVTQKRIVIESLAGTPPEFLTLHLKRFDRPKNKVKTQIELPADNKLTLIVDRKNVDYEIHAVEAHRGSSVDVGHYFSYIKKESGWVEANDESIVPLKKLPASVETDAYIIFLKRIS